MNISFPKSEWQQLKTRLSKGETIYTTRVSKERGKYLPGEVYQSPWGDTLRVKGVHRYDDINSHPFLSELNRGQVNTIKRYGDYDHIELEKQAGIREWVQSIRERLAPKPKKRTMTAEDVIRQAAKKNHTIQMKYVDKKGKESFRETEPYEIKDGHYWGYSLDADKPGIRKFNMERIRSMKETPTTYHPRWAVKLARDYTIAGGQWGEGEKLPEGVDRSARMKYDNAIGGGRYTPKYRNSFIRMKIRGSNTYSNQL